MEPGLTRQHYFAFWKRMMIFWWLMFPFALFAPAWNAVASNPLKTGAWVGYVVLGVPILALWLWMLKIGRLLWRLMGLWEEEDVARAREQALKDRLTIIRAERLQRAETRLARLHQQNEEAEREQIAADLLDLRDELGND